MCYPLSIIYTNILEYGTCPGILKKAVIIPIFKKGDPSLAVNYRPISLLPSLLIVYDIILSYNLSY